MTKEFCNNVITIPQINGTCWFNALMMMIFYSQNSRKLLLHYKPFKGRNDILSKTLGGVKTSSQFYLYDSRKAS